MISFYATVEHQSHRKVTWASKVKGGKREQMRLAVNQSKDGGDSRIGRNWRTHFICLEVRNSVEDMEGRTRQEGKGPSPSSPFAAPRVPPMKSYGSCSGGGGWGCPSPRVVITLEYRLNLGHAQMPSTSDHGRIYFNDQSI